jgi:hypothetical protein
MLTPSWLNPIPILNLESQMYKQSEINLFIIQQYYSEIRQERSEYCEIYADGSNGDHRVASTLVFGQQVAVFHLYVPFYCRTPSHTVCS